MKKILITESVILNTGDAAILFGILNFLKKIFPDSDIRIHCSHFGEASKRYSDLNLRRGLAECTRQFPPRFFWRYKAAARYKIWHKLRGSLLQRFAKIIISEEEYDSLKDYEWADCIISCGGSFLTDTYYIDHVLDSYWVGLALNKRMAILGQTLGPFQEESNCQRVSDVIADFNCVLVRDERSFNLGIDMGLEADRLKSGVDMALCIDPYPQKLEKTDVLKIGVSVRKWVYPGNSNVDLAHSNYINEMASLLDRLVLEKGALIYFISTCQGADSYYYHDDHVALEISEKMSYSEKVSIDSSFHSPIEFMGALDEFDIFIGTRMHACILSLLRYIPVINIEYEFKSRELFKKFDMEEYVFDINGLRQDKMFEAAVKLINNRKKVSLEIEQKVSKLRFDLNVLGESVQKLLN